jgi:hypothetical protein
MRVTLTVLALALFAENLRAAGITFSLDIASPSLLGGDFNASNVLTPGPKVFSLRSSLGLSADDSFGDFSFGNDPISLSLYFSVDRVAVGLPGSDVYVNSAAGGANGSVYQTLPASGSNSMYLPSPTLGITGGLFGDDVHGLSLMPYTGDIYFTLEPGSARLEGRSAADIFLNSVNNVFATHTMMGLEAGDAIDGLVLCHLCSPGIDQTLFSISAFSPSSTLMGGSKGPGDIYYTRFQGSSSLFASASSLGLREDDELHGLATVPEPGSFVLMGIGIALMVGSAMLRWCVNPDRGTCRALRPLAGTWGARMFYAVGGIVLVLSLIAGSSVFARAADGPVCGIDSPEQTDRRLLVHCDRESGCFDTYGAEYSLSTEFASVDLDLDSKLLTSPYNFSCFNSYYLAFVTAVEVIEPLPLDEVTEIGFQPPPQERDESRPHGYPDDTTYSGRFPSPSDSSYTDITLVRPPSKELWPVSESNPDPEANW